MSKNIAIKAENLGKAYQLGQIGTGTISRDLERWYASMRGKEDPFLRIGETNDRSTKGESDVVWSLRDLNFEIEQGDAVGIIGRNGAGKSTLLKILSKVTAPTTGKISGQGRIASLLEVGTGFHPELSGRENIFLNGAILGMRKKEIQRKFDEIVDFAGIERYIDTPVKRYSSGMYVRLAFAVAAHLESEILIVDEVLAVGDAEFQKKCLGKMGDVSKGEGRTVLFVSHNMGSIKQLCNTGILLNNGLLQMYGLVDDAILEYNMNLTKTINEEYIGKGLIKIANIKYNNSITYNSGIKIQVEFDHNIIITNICLGIKIKDHNGASIIAINNKHYLNQPIVAEGVKKGTIVITINELKLFPGKYFLDLFLGDSISDIEIVENAISFEISESDINNTKIKLDKNLNKIFLEDVKWEYEH